jgi:hypothetical protein
MNVQIKLSVGGTQLLLPFEQVAPVCQDGGALGA